MAGSVFNVTLGTVHFPGTDLSPSPSLDVSAQEYESARNRNAVRAGATCDDTKPPCFASVMPESPQTMISLVANYAAAITTLPRKTGLHYCRAATQNTLTVVSRAPGYRAVFLD